MNKLIPHIEYLLLSHDCVIVPGLGAILAHSVAPYYDVENECWQAPVRVFSFNPALSRTDGLLASSVARREGISIEAASAIVRKESEAMLTSLDSEKRLTLGAAGSIEMDGEGLLSFTPGSTAWLSPSYLWLPSVNIKPLQRASELAQLHDDIDRKRNMPYFLRRCGQIAACIAVLITLGWIAVQNLTYAPEEQFASMWPNVTSEQNGTVKDAENSPVVLILSQAPKDEVVENIPSENIVKSQEKVNASKKYFLIVASLASQDEADKFLRQNSDFNLGILAKDGRYRIYAASGNTAEEVMAASKESGIASRYPNSWVCRNNN